MADEQMGLTVKIDAEVGGALDGNTQVLDSLQAVEDHLLAVSDAGKASGDGFAQGASKAVSATREIGAAQQAVISDLQARMAQHQAMTEAISNMEIALKIKNFENEAQMGRMSLENQLENLQKLASATEAASAARIAAERAVQDVHAQLVLRDIEAMRAEVAEGKLSAEQQAESLRSISTEAEYGLKVRSIAATEAARIEADQAKIAAAAVAQAAKDEALAFKAAKAQEMEASREASKKQQELAYLAMDVGYIVPGGGQLSNVAYLMRDIGSASPVMIAGVAAAAVALATLGVAAELAKTGIQNAAKEESAMSEIGISVKNQGGDWDIARGQIDQWATALGRATTFSRQEALTALNDLTERGIGYADAQRIINVSTEVAAAKHKDLIPIVESLSTMEGIRASGLVKMDYGLRQLIQSHATQQQVLDYLSRTYAGQAAGALDTYDGKQKLLQNTMEHISAEIGVKLIPYMDGAAVAAIGLADAFEQNFDRIAKTVKGAIDEVHNLWTSLIPDFNIMEGPQAEIESAYQKTDASSSLLNSVMPGSKSFIDSNVFGEEHTASADEISSNSLWMRLQSEGQARIKSGQSPFDAIKKSEGTTLDHNDTIGTPKGGAGSAAPAESMDKAANQAERLTDVQEHLKKQLEDLSAGEDQYKLRVELATTADQKQDEEMALHAKVAADAAIAIKDIQAANRALSGELQKLTPEQNAQNASYEHALSAYNAFIASLHGGKPANEQQKQTLHDLKSALDQTWNAYNTTHQAVTKLTSELDANNRQLEKQEHNLQAVAIAKAAIDRAYNDSITNNSEKNLNERNTYGQSLEWQEAYWRRLAAAVDKASYSYEDANKRRAEYLNQADNLDTKIYERDFDWNKNHSLQIQQLQDEEATYNMSLDQQKKYYEQRLGAQESADGGYSEEDKRLWDEIVRLEGEEFKQRADAHKQLMAEITKEETTFLDDVLSKHQSFRDDLKTVWNDIEKNITQSIEKTLTENAFKDLNKNILGALSPSGGGGAASSGLFADLGIGSHGATPTGTESSPFSVRLVDDSITKITGSSTGLSAASSDGATLPVSFDDSFMKSLWSSLSPDSKNQNGDISLGADRSSDAAQYGILGLELGAGGASRAISSLPTDAGLLGIQIGDNSTSTASAFTADTQNGSFGEWGSPDTPTTKSLIGKGLSDLATGATIGGAINPGGNSTNAGIGDTLGTLAALATNANPLAGAALAIGGDLIGSLFGPHETAAQTPDTQPGYQAFIADMTGQTQVSNGTPTFANSTYDTTIGNKSQSQQLSDWLNNPANVASLPAGAQQAYKNLVADEAGDTNDGIDPIASSIHQGNITLASGKTVSVAQYESDINTIQQLAAQSGGTTPVFQLSRSYPSFTSNISSQLGTVNNDTNAFTPSGASSSELRTTQATQSTQPQINVNVDLTNANLIGTVPDAVLNQIATKLKDASNGLTPGAYNPPLAFRRTGN